MFENVSAPSTSLFYVQETGTSLFVCEKKQIWPLNMPLNAIFENYYEQLL